ncbi:hypothetical protein QUB63_31150 [Microcoleus sp. ARI1-B5]|uniref:hypothetical protein n=1 Tax=unclassified Microcoleus TaxID=2642155 RepID=UPI002FD2251C
MGASTRIVLVPIRASQKLPANCLADYAAAVHPDMHTKQRRSIGNKVFAGHSQDLAGPDMSPYCQANLTEFS